MSNFWWSKTYPPNVILGRPTLNVAKAVIVPHLMLMKFECDENRQVWIVYGDQELAWTCYVTALKPLSTETLKEPRVSKKRKSGQVKTVMGLNLMPHPEPECPMEDYQLNKNKLDWTVKVGQPATTKVGKAIKSLFSEYKDVFAFTIEEMVRNWSKYCFPCFECGSKLQAYEVEEKESW